VSDEYDDEDAEEITEETRHLCSTFDAILLNGSPEDLRAFLAPLDEPTRVCLYASRNRELRPGRCPMDYCIYKALADHVAVLFECGASAAAPTIEDAFWAAVDIAISYRFIRILKVVVAEARSQNRLVEAMQKLKSRNAQYSDVSRMFWYDFAPVLGILLDAGLGSDDTFPHVELVSYAASSGALACLQLLHERCSRDEWSQLLTPVPGMISESPLARAFKERKADAFEYLLSFHSPSGADGPDLLSHEGVNSALAILARHAPDQALPLQARLDAARAAYDSWEARTQVETVLVLHVASSKTRPDLQESAAFTGSFRAVAALAQFGLTPSQELLQYAAQTEATAGAILDALVAAKATPSQGELIDAATLRQQTAARLIRTLPWLSDAAKYVLLTSAAPDIQAETMAKTLRSCCCEINYAFGLRIARATIEAAQATEATAAALNTPVTESWKLLSLRVRSGEIAQAQLLADIGADVFVTEDRKSLLEEHFDLPRPSGLKVTPPPIADPTVFAATAPCTFASADAARAHAAAAAAEEERLFAALLKDPEVIQRISQHSPAWYVWAQFMNSVLGARWVWRCMYERDPERAHAYLDPSASGLNLGAPLLKAVSKRDVRRVRFFTSLGARMSLRYGKRLAQSCLDGNDELSWALLDALPDDAAERATILEAVTYEGRHTALAGVALAVLDGHRFSPPLAEALLAAGATVPRTLLFALCDPGAQGRPVTSLPGELARALRWTLEHFQRTHSSCVV